MSFFFFKRQVFVLSANDYLIFWMKLLMFWTCTCTLIWKWNILYLKYLDIVFPHSAYQVVNTSVFYPLRCPRADSWQPYVNNLLIRPWIELSITNVAYCHSNVKTLCFVTQCNHGWTKCFQASFVSVSGPVSLTVSGLRPSAVRCIRPPLAFGFPTQLPGSILIPITIVCLPLPMNAPPLPI